MLSQKPWLPHTVSLAHSSMSAGQWTPACGVHSHSLYSLGTLIYVV